MTPVKQQLSKFKAEESYQVGFNVLWRLYTHERSLSESSRSYMLAHYLSVIGLLAIVLFTFRTDLPHFNFSPILGPRQFRPTR